MIKPQEKDNQSVKHATTKVCYIYIMFYCWTGYKIFVIYENSCWIYRRYLAVHNCNWLLPRYCSVGTVCLGFVWRGGILCTVYTLIRVVNANRNMWFCINQRTSILWANSSSIYILCYGSPVNFYFYGLSNLMTWEIYQKSECFPPSEHGLIGGVIDRKGYLFASSLKWLLQGRYMYHPRAFLLKWQSDSVLI